MIKMALKLKADGRLISVLEFRTWQDANDHLRFISPLYFVELVS